MDGHERSEKNKNGHTRGMMQNERERVRDMEVGSVREGETADKDTVTLTEE